MFLLPLLILIAIGWAVYKLVHRQPQVVGASGAAVARPHLFWPTSALGWSGIGMFSALLVLQTLINVVQVPFLGWLLLAGTVAFTAVGRFGKHDRSAAVLIVFIVASVAALAALLFLAGEVFIGHD